MFKPIFVNLLSNLSPSELPLRISLCLIIPSNFCLLSGGVSQFLVERGGSRRRKVCRTPRFEYKQRERVEDETKKRGGRKKSWRGIKGGGAAKRRKERSRFASAADEKCTIISFLLAAPPPPHLAPPLSRKRIIGALLQGPFPSSRTATSTAVVVLVLVIVVPPERRTFDDRGTAQPIRANLILIQDPPFPERKMKRQGRGRRVSTRDEGRGLETLLPRYCASMNRDPWATKVSTGFYPRNNYSKKKKIFHPKFSTKIVLYIRQKKC